jgi:hypothetical protein
MKRRNDITMKEAINEMLNTFHLKERLNEKKLTEHWEKLFGKTINKYTTKITVREGKLYLKVESASLRQELLFNKEKMIATINAEIAAGFVKEIILS